MIAVGAGIFGIKLAKDEPGRKKAWCGIIAGVILFIPLGVVAIILVIIRI